MSKLIIQGGKRLTGEVQVKGSKNAALPMIAASLLTNQEVVLKNVPDILDVKNLLSIMTEMGIGVSNNKSTVAIKAKEINSANLRHDLVGKLRGSILLMGAILGRERKVTLVEPGGDVIGARPIDAHLDAFKQLGAKVRHGVGKIVIDGKDMKAGEIVLREFSVTATENAMLVAATLPGKTTIEVAAAEPHVEALGEMLIKMGADISGLGTHTIVVKGKRKLRGATVRVIPDMLEAGLWILIAMATKSRILIKGVPVNNLKLFLKTLREMGANFTVQGSNILVMPKKMSGFKFQALPYPGNATDLQAPFSVLATQIEGTSIIHDPMYEGRFKHCDELVKMGAKVTVCDPHRVIIEGPSRLVGRRINSLDIRAGATLIVAGLVAEGETVINNAEVMDRGYEDLAGRLCQLGADIERLD